MRELETKEKEEIRKILLRITELLRNNKDDILTIGEKVMYLDILNAKSIYANDNRCEIPTVSNREILSLEKARHPFIDKGNNWTSKLFSLFHEAKSLTIALWMRLAKVTVKVIL